MKREDLVLEEGVRVALITLGAREGSPRHHHSSVIDDVVCVSGRITLNLTPISAPVILVPGQRYESPPGLEHWLLNPEDVTSTYLLVQRGADDFVTSNS